VTTIAQGSTDFTLDKPISCGIVLASVYTKLFSSLTDSTIWREEDHTRLVWITMLAMADKTGHVMASVPGLADRARVSIEKTVSALEKLAAPDKWSRSKECDGRRIEEIGGGWSLINYTKYRRMRNEEERKEYMRNYMRNRRKQAVNKVSNVNSSKPPLAQAEAEVEYKAVEGLKAENTKNKIHKGGGFAETAEPRPFELAIKFLEMIGLPQTPANRGVVTEAIKAEAKYSGREAEAVCTQLASKVLDDREAGVPIDKFYFEDSKWRRNGNGGFHESKEQARQRRNKAVLDKFTVRNVAASG
jgi:hypothetical protein